jgi:alkylhydroperoxidase family enzyme
VSEATYKALAAHFDHELMVDLVLTISFYCAVVRALSSLAIEVEPEYQPYLDQYPLPV